MFSPSAAAPVRAFASVFALAAVSLAAVARGKSLPRNTLIRAGDWLQLADVRVEVLANK